MPFANLFLRLEEKRMFKLQISNPLKPATATIVAFKVMIGHNLQTDCARESVKTFLDLEDSN